MSEHNALLPATQTTPTLTLAESDVHVSTVEADSIQQVLHMPAVIHALRDLLSILPRYFGLDFTDDTTWYLHGLIRAIHRGYCQSVQHPHPCPMCGQPVATLRLFSEAETFIVDVVEDPDPKVPEFYRWTVDIFEPHVCPVDEDAQ